MILEVSEFRRRVVEDLPILISELQSITGRFGEEEAGAWKNSLPRLAKAFSSSGFDSLHLYFNGTGALSLEYQLPAASSWCDVVLLGRSSRGPGAVIIELKHWQTQGDYPAGTVGLINHLGQQMLHPSDQVRGYVEYCRRFHSTVHDHGAVINGCVFFTQNTNIQAYGLPPNNELTRDFPCFSYSESDLSSPFPAFIAETITESDLEFAKAFERGTYKQDRGFVRQIGEQILHPENSPFVLLDNQRRAFSLCRAQVEASLFQQGSIGAKKVIVVEGPPGSGKSVVAAKIWASLATDEKMPDGPIVFTSTSASQNSNWSRLFAQTAAEIAGAGIVKKATSYTPITTATLGRLRKKFGEEFLGDATTWRENIKVIRSLGTSFSEGAHDSEYLVSVVDEAHALINPEHKEGRPQGISPGMGPQAYHIIRVSQVTIFLLDERQSFRTQENTTVVDIRAWAAELGAEFFTVSLAGNQFRCAGSKEYVDWVEAVLEGMSPETCRVLSSAWKKQPKMLPSFEGIQNIVPFPEPKALSLAAEEPPRYRTSSVRPLSGTLDFQIFDNPAAMEHSLRQRLVEGNSARLLAPYARPWVTRPNPKAKGQANPHDLPEAMRDIIIKFQENGETKTWAKIWNLVEKNGTDYSAYIQGTEGSRMYADPLCEVGCPYTVRGFDWDYVGILWFSDLAMNPKNHRWFANPEHSYETGFKSLISRARNERALDGPHHQNLLEAVIQSYRILLTRPIRGIYLWFEDANTRQYIESVL